MKSPLSPRRRRLRWTIATLVVALLAGAGITWDAWHRSRPVSYRPDETSDSITSELVRALPPGAPRPLWTDVTVAAGLEGFRNFAGHRTSQLPEDMGPGLAWGDFDNDGDEDLFLVSAGGALDLTVDQLRPCALFENLGDGTFRRVDAFPELRLRGMGAAWGDYDGDGWLDLAISGYQELRLLRNESGTGAFVMDARIDAPRRFWSGVGWGDFNNDRRLDLYVCAYVEYSENESDREVVSDQLGTAVPFTLNPASYPGGRNALYRQNADGSFTDVAAELGVENPAGRSLGALWHDFDQDGWLDLVCVNGNTIEETGPPPRKLKPQVPFLFWNRQGQSFHDLAPLHPDLATAHVSRGLGLADYDNDGDLDLAIADLYEGVRLFRNERVTGNWLTLRLRSRHADGEPTGHGEGSTAVAWIDGVPLRRSVTGVSYLSQDSRVLHWGLDAAARVERLEVHWHAGGSSRVENLEANTHWIWTENEPAPQPFTAKAATATITTVAPAATSTAARTDRDRILQFWELHRSAMDALKREKDPATAIPLFRRAIELDPHHEDARYYLALCLSAQGDPAGALEALAALRTINPQSHRAWQQWGIIRAQSAVSDADLGEAEASLERAQAINTAETGALFLLGEVSLLRRQFALAETRLAAVCQSNPKAAGAYFLRGYLSWKNGNAPASTGLLLRAREALGPDWQPQGATSEGDVRAKQHEEVNLLAPFWQTWTGEANPGTAFTYLESFLRRHPTGSWSGPSLTD